MGPTRTPDVVWAGLGLTFSRYTVYERKNTFRRWQRSGAWKRRKPARAARERRCCSRGARPHAASLCRLFFTAGEVLGFAD